MNVRPSSPRPLARCHVYSATKRLAAMVMALAHSRCWLDYDERVCTYWPEFAHAGKERITVRQLLAHQAELFAFDEPVDREGIGDLDRLAMVRPASGRPGSRRTCAHRARRRAVQERPSRDSV